MPTPGAEIGALSGAFNHMARTCEDLLWRKDLLFKEVNHRILNCLQVLSSAISVQRARIADREAREQMSGLQRRVITTGIILRRIYRTDTLERVEFGVFLRELCADLERSLLSYNLEGRLRVSGDGFVVPIDWVIPLGSMTVEMITTIAEMLRPTAPYHGIIVALQAGQTLDLTIVADGPVEAVTPAGDSALRADIVRLFAEQLSAHVETLGEGAPAGFVIHLPLPELGATTAAP